MLMRRGASCTQWWRRVRWGILSLEGGRSARGSRAPCKVLIRRHVQGRILHTVLEEDAVGALLAAHRLSPWRAEPLVYLAWQYARRMQGCLNNVDMSGRQRDPACLTRNRAAAYLYSLAATKLPLPPVRFHSIERVVMTGRVCCACHVLMLRWSMGEQWC